MAAAQPTRSEPLALCSTAMMAPDRMTLASSSITSAAACPDSPVSCCTPFVAASSPG